MEIENSIGKKLLHWRVEFKFGQLMLAEHLNISQSAYSQLEHGKRTLTLHEAHKICKLYDKRMFELFPNHQHEINKSELFWVQKFEASHAKSLFNSEKQILATQNKELKKLLNVTLTLYDSISKVFEIRNKNT